MLLLDRKKGQAVIIRTPEGRSIRIIVMADTEFGTKLGFEADREVYIDREEKVDK